MVKDKCVRKDGISVSGRSVSVGPWQNDGSREIFLLNFIHKWALILESESFFHIEAVSIISPSKFF